MSLEGRGGMMAINSGGVLDARSVERANATHVALEGKMPILANFWARAGKTMR
jgi:hypothetical protein